MNKKGCFFLFLGFTLVGSVACNVFLFLALLGLGIDEGSMGIVQDKPRYGEALEQDKTGDTKDKIVRIDLEGIISSNAVGGLFADVGMNVDGAKRALEQAVADKHVKGIVLYVNSPGGEVTASDTLYHAVKQAAASKPVVVYMDSVAASGGYYLSCGATKIVANETTQTGSIGVIIQAINYSEIFGKVGLETVTFTSGKFKDTLSGSRPMREDEKAYVQLMINQMYDKFVSIVAEARKLDKQTLKDTVADGRVLTGGDALASKLVDQLGYVEDAYALAKQLSGAPNAMVVKYRRDPSLAEIFGVLGKASATPPSVKIDVSNRLLPRLEPGKVYLLPAHMVP